MNLMPAVTQLLIATRNKGKFPEITAKLRGMPFRFFGLHDVSSIPAEYEVEESAMTFEGNAIVKAMAYGKKTGMKVLADDSGLEVDALGGKPGVHSNRWAPGTSEDRNRKLLQEMAEVPDDKRGAQFRCVVALYDPSREMLRTCEGVCRGGILRESRGANGFGYDPIFFVENLGKTMAELTTEEKNNVSHRGRALEKARSILEEEFLS